MTLTTLGWELFDDPALLPWVSAVAPVARALAEDPDTRAAWLRHGGTWFAGVNVLPNDADGAVPGGAPLTGHAVTRANELHGPGLAWDTAQISIVYPGYPKQDASESDAAFRFRRDRDAAHVDGLLPLGPERRRKMVEPHAFVLGIPLTTCSADASPLVIWEESHVIIRAAFRDALATRPPSEWPNVDLTEVYHAARRRCFEECRRITVPAVPGQAYLIHRLALHGVAPWGPSAHAPEAGRMIAYFRPPFPGADWLTTL
ncbi:MAG: hypothetical protein AAF576_00945 [Pseudomonadota bacterium]